MRFKIKEKLKIWLLKDELIQLNDLIIKQNKMNSMILHNEDLIKTFLATCQTGYDIRVSTHHRNWCVFVKQSKSENSQDFVKFIDLSGMNFNEIRDFEKHLESLNKDRNNYSRHIDAPMGVKDYFIFR